MKTSGIGGQAVMEGVMMRNGSDYAVAVRKPDNTIEIKKDTYKSASTKSVFFRLPIVRGVVAFVDSLVLGFSTLTYSSELLEEDDDNYEPTGFEKFLIKVFKEKAADVVMTLVVMFSIFLAVGIFVLLPTFVAGLLGGLIKSELKKTLVEGLIRLVLFLVYVWIISLMKEIKRTYMYHGAEHKCINCIEAGKDLTVENVRESSRFHKRCGTSFLFIVMFISIIMFMFVRTDTFWLKIVYRLLLIPVISGISFEFIKLAGSKDNIILDILSTPGLLLQRLTTKEPDDDMIEIGIASVEAVFDWKSFVKKVRSEESETQFAAVDEATNEADNDVDGFDDNSIVDKIKFSTGQDDNEEEYDNFDLELEDIDLGSEFDDKTQYAQNSSDYQEEIENFEGDGNEQSDIEQFEDIVVGENDINTYAMDSSAQIEEDDFENDLIEDVDESAISNAGGTEHDTMASEAGEDEYQLPETENNTLDLEYDDMVLDENDDIDIEEREPEQGEELEQNEELEEIEHHKESEEGEESEEDKEIEESKEFEDAKESGDDTNNQIKGMFSMFRNKKKQSASAKERIANHVTLTEYDEDYDESDELLRELDRIVSEQELAKQQELTDTNEQESVSDGEDDDK